MRELLAPHGVEAVSAGELGLAEPEETGDNVRRQRPDQGGRRGEGGAASGLRRRFRPCGRCARRRARNFLGALGRPNQGFYRGDDADRTAAAGARRDGRPRSERRISSPRCAWPGPTVISKRSRRASTARWCGRRAARRLRLRSGVHARRLHAHLRRDDQHREARPAAARARRCRIAPAPSSSWRRSALMTVALKRRAGAFGVYVHWPFCLSKCPYCDFNSHVRHAADRRRALRARLRTRDRDHGRARAGPRRVVDLSRRRHAVPDAAAHRRRDSRCDRQSTGTSPPTPKSRWKPTRPASRPRAFAAIAQPASTGCRSACRRSMMPR